MSARHAAPPGNRGTRALARAKAFRPTRTQASKAFIAATVVVIGATAVPAVASTPERIVPGSAPATVRSLTMELSVAQLLADRIPENSAANAKAEAKHAAAVKRAQAATRADRAKRKAAAQRLAKIRAVRQARINTALARRWVWPLSSVGFGAGFGASGPHWESGHHTGQDFSANTGDKVHAIAAGTVIWASVDGPYGNLVKIRHSNGAETWYAHLSKFSVKAGQSVKVNQLVGRVGCTGNCFGSHLHVEVHPGGGAAVSPRPYLSAKIKATKAAVKAAGRVKNK